MLYGLVVTFMRVSCDLFETIYNPRWPASLDTTNTVGIRLSEVESNKLKICSRKSFFREWFENSKA
jgi:hypothetical protein